ncbi:hypothetical protein Tco_0588635, partial [Tanacetum coccineum]
GVTKDGIFISQDKYVAKILKKFNYTDVKSASTLVDLENPLVKDGDADDVDVHLYRSMIGSLMYLTTSRPDIIFAVCACARFQVTSKTSHLLEIKRIFRYLKGKPTLGLWYSRDSPFEIVAYTDSDYAGATQDRKSTTKGCQFWEIDLLTKGFDAGRISTATAKVQIVNGVRQLQALVDKKRVIVTELSIRRDLHLDDAEGKLSSSDDQRFGCSEDVLNSGEIADLIMIMIPKLEGYNRSPSEFRVPQEAQPSISKDKGKGTESKEKKIEGSEETAKGSRKNMLRRKRATTRILKEIKNGGRQRVR